MLNAKLPINLGAKAFAMILNAKLPINLRAKALTTACHIHNRVSSLKTKISPHEVWKGRKPTNNTLKSGGALHSIRSWILIDPSWD